MLASLLGSTANSSSSSKGRKASNAAVFKSPNREPALWRQGVKAQLLDSLEVLVAQATEFGTTNRQSSATPRLQILGQPLIPLTPEKLKIFKRESIRDNVTKKCPGKLREVIGLLGHIQNLVNRFFARSFPLPTGVVRKEAARCFLLQ